MTNIVEQTPEKKSKLSGYLCIISTIIISIYLYKSQTADGLYYTFLITLILIELGTAPQPEKDNSTGTPILIYLIMYGIFLIYNSEHTALSNIHFWFGLFIGIILPIGIWIVFNEDFSTLEKKKFVAENQLNIDKRIVIDETKEILIDIQKEKLILWNNQTCKQSLEYKMLNFKDITDFDLIEDGFSKEQGRGMVSAVGYLAFGVTGAIIGTVAGDRKSKNFSSNLYVNLGINDLETPLITVPFMEKQIDKSSNEYQNALKKAQEFIAVLKYIKNNQR